MDGALKYRAEKIAVDVQSLIGDGFHVVVDPFNGWLTGQDGKPQKSDSKTILVRSKLTRREWATAITPELPGSEDDRISSRLAQEAMRGESLSDEEWDARMKEPEMD